MVRRLPARLDLQGRRSPQVFDLLVLASEGGIVNLRFAINSSFTNFRQRRLPAIIELEWQAEMRLPE
jgi:hypothetical protein